MTPRTVPVPVPYREGDGGGRYTSVPRGRCGDVWGR